MNPRQRRGVVVLVLAMIAGLATFVAVFRYVTLVNTQVGPLAQAIVAVQDVEPWAPITEASLQFVDVPERWMPDTAVRDPQEVIGLVAPTGLQVGAVVQQGMLVTPPALGEGEREYAITLDAETGVAGQLSPESVVDVVAAFALGEDRPPEARSIVLDARVLTVDGVGGGAEPPTFEEEEDAGPETASVPESQTVTLSLTSTEALDVAYAQSYADRVRLVLVPPGRQPEGQGDQPRVRTAPIDEVQP